MGDLPLRLTVLGPFRAWREEEVDLGPVRQRALLAALLMRPDTTVSQQELLDGVWGLEPPGTGIRVVPVYVHRLRKCLRSDNAEDVIASDRGGYRFVSKGVDLDATQLEQHTSEATAKAKAGDLANAVTALRQAVELFQGEPLAGLPGPYAAGQRQRLAEKKIALTLRKAEWQLELGAHAEVIGELKDLAETHPHHEPLAGLLMRALHRTGRRADALNVFTQLRRRLVADLGVEPGSEVRQVHEDLLQEEPLKRTSRNELPAPTAVVGRKREIAQITETNAKVIAVDGVPGAGKTALVVHAAHLMHEKYADGCLFVDLHGHSENREPLHPRLALRRLLRVIGAHDSSEDLDELAAEWRSATAESQLLLVLDNAAGAEQVRPLLPGPRSRVLVTSRQRLAGITADKRISLGALEIDAAQELLWRIAPRPVREPGAMRELARLCGRLPLALCIAGARLQTRPMWTFDYLANRLADDERRLGELTAEDRSVEAALKLSYEQLPRDEQEVFRVLGLSPTPEFDPLAVAAMLGRPVRDAEEVLEQLVDASLVQQPAAGRYRMHDLVAVYAQRLIREEPTAREATTEVLRLYVAAARCASDWGVQDSPQGPWLGEHPFAGWADASAWLDAAGSDLVDVVGYAAKAGEVDYACWIAEGLVEYLNRQGRYHECRAALEIALPLVERASDPRMVAALRNGLGIAYGMQGHYESSAKWFDDASLISMRTGQVREHARALAGLGTLARVAGRSAEAIARLTEVLELSRRIDDDWLAGLAIANIGEIHHQLGRTDEALECVARGIELAEKLDNPRAIGMALGSLGTIQLELGRHAEAAAALEQAANLAEEVGDVALYALCLTRWGSVEQNRGNAELARELHHRALAEVTEHTRPELEQEIRARLVR